MRIGILTGGGDAPGLNGVIESCARVLLEKGIEVIGIRDGFEGIFNQNVIPLFYEQIHQSHALAGTLLGSSNKSTIKGRETEFIHKYKSLKLDGLIACGGDGTFSALSRVSSHIDLIGVPKTIDNDLQGTDVTFGYDTACAVVADSVDSLRFTAEAHDRVLVVETMGRTAGWIALGGGLASYSDVILIPERPYDKSKLLNFVKEKREKHQRALMIVVAEGAFAEGENPSVAFIEKNSPQKERYGGAAFQLSRWIENETHWESRHVVLGHLQRARNPTTADRFLTLNMGVVAAEQAVLRKWNQAVVYRSGQVTTAPISDIMGPARLVDSDHEWVQRAQALGMFI